METTAIADVERIDFSPVSGITIGRQWNGLVGGQFPNVAPAVDSQDFVLVVLAHRHPNCRTFCQVRQTSRLAVAGDLGIFRHRVLLFLPFTASGS